MNFFRPFARFSPAPVGISSRSRLRGTRGGNLYTTVQVWSRPGFVARALGVQSRETWQVIAGLVSDQLEPTRPMQTPKMFFPPSFLHLQYISAAVYEVPQQPSKVRQSRHNSRASTCSLSDSHERCFCVWVRERVRVCVIVGSYSRKNQEQSEEQVPFSFFFSLFFIFATTTVVVCCLLLRLCACVTP